MPSDVLGYLNSKGLHVRRGSGDEVHIPCMFHGEDPQERGRLYVNVNPAAEIPGLFHCKVCGEKGSLVTLKRHFGDDEKITKVDEDSAVRRQILASAAAFYAENLVEHPEAVKWLKGPERGLTVHTLRDYQIGYAEGGLFFHLRNEGFDTGDIMATGLVVEDRTTKKPTDFFKRQITIPYTTAGNVVMIRGRTWPYDGDGPKYLTPPGQTTRLFNSDTIWSDTDPAHVLVTEGEFDCLVLQQLGFVAVGVPGAQIWQDAWDGYVSGVRRLYTIFDRDKAGEEGTRKLRDRFGPKVRPVHLSAEGVKTDPTAWVADGGTAEQLNDLLESAERRGSLLVGVTEARNAHAELAAMSGVKFGSEMLDLLIDPGLLPTQVMVVLAKTGTGKTIWLLNMMQRMRMVAGQEDLKFLFVSLEQTAGEWWERAKRIHRFYNLEATDDDCAAWWADNIQIVEQNRVTELELHSALDDFEYRIGQPPDVVMIDYLGYWAQSYKGERYQRTSDAIMAMKAIAKDRRIRVISPHQVSRVAKDGEDFGGDAARDAGVVEETADFLFAIWNPDNTLGRAEEDRSGIVNLRIAKSRHGGRGQKIMFQWAPISLALVPHGSGETEHLTMARNELEFEQNRDNWEQAIYRHQTGIVKGTIPRHPTRQQELA